ncbi:hypothetical protein T265_05719 [Opisthorchis viverrini]|uniref:Uncharacterized protein n=1 Tax=Opisthorchis viverrini TaxID=6198 RepID=A0A074ZV03_OPIVI|nr:hypothetical protein T265_05719 [Opisthorchis viverrini]KER27185.1 hypothetical protein T265_05719 [Opisthorchis viverrini]
MGVVSRLNNASLFLKHTGKGVNGSIVHGVLQTNELRYNETVWQPAIKHTSMQMRFECNNMRDGLELDQCAHMRSLRIEQGEKFSGRWSGGSPSLARQIAPYRQVFPRFVLAYRREIPIN